MNRGILILLAFCHCAFALNPSLDISQYAHTSWKIREGFITGSIFTMAQTPDGYLWFGTAFCLFRFDGIRAVLWQPPGDAQLPSQRIDPLLVGRDGTLWIATDKGLASWRNGKLTTYPEVKGRRIDSLLQDAEGTLWFGIENPGRLCAVRAATTQCYGAGSFGSSIPALYQDHKGNLWVSSETGLWRWAPGRPKNYTVPGNAVKAHEILEGDKGELLMATSSSLGVISGAGEGLKQLVDGKIVSYPLPDIAGHFRPTRMLRSSDGSLWVGTLQGLLHVHDGRIDRFDGLAGATVFRIFEDREGSVWVSTPDGLDRFREFAAPTISVDQGLSNSAVHGLEATPDGSIWISEANGLSRWQNGRVTVYGKRRILGRDRRTDERDLLISSRVTEIPNSGLRNTAYALGRDNQGRLWVGGREGVFYFDGRRFVSAPGVSGGSIFSIGGDQQGGIWISNDEGLFHRTAEGTIQRIGWARFGHKNPAADLLADEPQGGVWLGFVDGGIAYFRDGQMVSSYRAADGLSNGAVTALQTGSDGAVWVASAGGLSRVKDSRLTTLTSKNGLPCDGVSSVIEDDNHSLWLYMPCGLVRIPRSEVDGWVSDSKRSVRATIFDSFDGVRTRGVTGQQRPLMTKSPDGKIWFAPPDGVSFIDPRHIAINNFPPPVHIEQIIADGNTYGGNLHLRLPALTRDLEIDYTALSLVAPERNRFKYKLEGYNSDWQDVGNRRQAFYSNLPPTNYRFRVMASNNSGVWNEAGNSLDFSIAPAYYQTIWFQASCVAVFLGLVWALYQYRLHQAAREFNVRLEERVSERVRIARELHDTLLQTVQGLMLRLQVVGEMLPPGKAKEELEETLEVGDQAILEGRNTVRDLRSPLSTNDLAQAVRELGDELARGSSTIFRLVVEGRVRDLHPAVRDEFYRIAREALRNAFDHAGAKQIEAEITYEDPLFRLRIRDDGQGIPAEILDEGRSGHFGLAGMRERAKQLGSKLTIWSGAGTGTEIDVSVAGSFAYSKPPASSRFWRWGRKVVSR